MYVGNGKEGDWVDNEAIRLHLACLKYYSYIFDDVVIVISTDDEQNKPFLDDVKKILVETITVPSITLKMAKNTPLREATTFLDEVVKSDYDGITFFGHSKGITNIVNPLYKHDYIVDWILGLYWIPLHFADEAERCITFSTQLRNSFFFGPFPCVERDGSVFEKTAYEGAFYWVNMNSVKHEFYLKGLELPKICTRLYAEEFPGYVCKELNIFQGTYEGMRQYVGVFDMYGKRDDEYSPLESIKFQCMQDQNLIQNYLEFKQKILSDSERYKKESL